MPPKRKRTKRKKTKRHIVLILLLILAGIFLFYEESGRENIQKEIYRIFKPKREAKVSPKHPKRPKIAVVIDDLGPSKTAAQRVLNIRSPFTFSILPHEVYTTWIANEAHRLGHEIIGHIPMEARTPHELGKGGLYTWMTDGEIAETFDEDLNSIPYIKGISNHMGSAFTEDERAMHVVISELKKHRLFFLDSLTTSKSVGFRLARARDIKTFQRDVFLDEQDSPAHIKAQWGKLLKIARERGYAVALAHPRKNTLVFLENTLKNSNVKIVPLSELIE